MSFIKEIREINRKLTDEHEKNMRCRIQAVIGMNKPYNHVDLKGRCKHGFGLPQTYLHLILGSSPISIERRLQMTSNIQAS